MQFLHNDAQQPTPDSTFINTFCTNNGRAISQAAYGSTALQYVTATHPVSENGKL